MLLLTDIRGGKKYCSCRVHILAREDCLLIIRGAPLATMYVHFIPHPHKRTDVVHIVCYTDNDVYTHAVQWGYWLIKITTQ